MSTSWNSFQSCVQLVLTVKSCQSYWQIVKHTMICFLKVCFINTKFPPVCFLKISIFCVMHRCWNPLLLNKMIAHLKTLFFHKNFYLCPNKFSFCKRKLEHSTGKHNVHYVFSIQINSCSKHCQRHKEPESWLLLWASFSSHACRRA